MISLKDGIRSLVHIDFKGRVHKRFRGTNAKERCENEIHVLEVLEQRGCPNVPRLLDSKPEENYIITSNCGSPVENIISAEKAKTLFDELKNRYGIQHDDPEPRNVTYNPKLGKFCLIDFELATVLPLPSDEEQAYKAARVQWASNSKQGRRHLTNQDSYLCYCKKPSGNKTTDDQGETLFPIDRLLFAVSDGVGGNHGGEFASKLVLSTMSHLLDTIYAGPPLSEDDYIELIRKINITINLSALKNPHSPRLSATYAGILIQEDTIMWANAGDSRVYRFRNNALEQLSYDHNFPFRQWKNGEMTEMQYRMHPGKNQIFDCMGGGSTSIHPEHGEVKWEPGDIYLICSDGIMDGLSDKKIGYIMEETVSDLNSTRAQNICSELLRQAVSNDGSDDTTLVVVEVL